MKVGELARRSGVTAETVRHYTDKGLLRPERDSANGYQLYPEQDIGRVRFIRRAKQLGFTLSEIGRLLGYAERGTSPCPEVRDLVQARIVENRRRLQALTALQLRLEQALNVWRALPDKVPDGDSICHLIETVTEISDEGVDLGVTPRF
ncbi:MerR family transcriptional regulator [Candidatus Tenderia electrophaga]|uniref:MerR family transcriptional regulator n=1 Tax=Candidatus Tenderia electrophaga TaxID=1748243 RepID=A0A0S2THV5_9GAMM|nr:MerR family transcriptional regulator [Candidatus Tenderia electrophaga]